MLGEYPDWCDIQEQLPRKFCFTLYQFVEEGQAFVT